MTMNYYGFVRVQRISAFEIATIAIELGILISKVLSTFSWIILVFRTYLKIISFFFVEFIHHFE